jgi:hypothetical protein
VPSSPAVTSEAAAGFQSRIVALEAYGEQDVRSSLSSALQKSGLEIIAKTYPARLPAAPGIKPAQWDTQIRLRPRAVNITLVQKRSGPAVRFAARSDRPIAASPAGRGAGAAGAATEYESNKRCMVVQDPMIRTPAPLA